MTTYLEEIAFQFSNSKEPLSSHIFVLPSKRASSFLKKAFLEVSHKTEFAPEILSIEDFIERISDLKIASSIELLFDFYDIYLNSDVTEKETFESFSSWAGILLDDFNEIDRNLINQERFFSYLKDIKSIEKWGVKNEPSELIKNYLNFWNSLHRLYKSFSDKALVKGKAHQGLVYREAANNMEHYTTASKDKTHIFIGFNALNKAEEIIIKELLEAGNAEIFWDAEAYFMEKNYHSASHFLREFKTQWKYYQTNPFKNISNHYTGAKNISIIGCSRNIGQAKCVAEILESVPENKLEKTALVLADEALLMPVLNALPGNIKSVNITMGLPLNLLPASSFFENIFKMHSQTENHFYYNDILQIIEHPLCARLIPISHKLIKNAIQSRNITQINFETILKLADAREQDSIHLLFSEINRHIDQLIQNVKNIILVLKAQH
jgi:ATP-dependent helicase/nuclease subunit B